MDQPREGRPIISSTTVRVNKRTRTDVAQESLASIQEDLKRTFTAYTSFRDRRADVAQHLHGRILKESQIPAPELPPVSEPIPPGGFSLPDEQYLLPNGTRSPQQETSIKTFDSLFFPDAADTPLNTQVIHIEEEYANRDLPKGMEIKMLQEDLDEPLLEFAEDFEEDSRSGVTTPVPWIHEEGSSQATESSQTSSFLFEANLTPKSSVINTFFSEMLKVDIAKSVKKRGFYSNGSGWINWPNQSDFALMPPGSRKEHLIAEKLTPLINAIIDISQQENPHLSSKMYALDGQEKCVYNRDGGTHLKPDIFICGNGSCFSFTPGASEPAEWEELRQWAYCNYPVEVKTASQRTREPDQAIAQMGTYVREVFAAQPNRRFVPSLIFTERTVEFLFWDRGGVLISERMDYHKHPVSFCNMMARLVAWDNEERGFDPYMSVINGVWKLHNEESFILVAKYFHPYTIFGRTVVCWRGLYIGRENAQAGDRSQRDLEDEERHVLVQDAWLPTEQITFLEDLLLTLRPSLDGIPGVMQEVRIERVRKLDGQTFDTISENRKNPSFRGNSDLCHVRIISVCQKNCIPLDMVTRSTYVCEAFQDIVAGIRCFYERYGYIQNDIKPWTILVQPGATGRQKGIMLNLYSLKKTSEGPHRERLPTSNNSILFESQNIWSRLPLSTVNNHLDGILSCYYILCFLVGKFRGPDIDDDQTLIFRPDLTVWEEGTEEQVAESKLGHFTGINFFQAQPGWDPSVDALIFSLHRFFHRRIRVLSNPLLDAKSPQEKIDIMKKFISNPVPSSLKRKIVQRDFDAVENCW